jgi:heat shock protein HslJ
MTTRAGSTPSDPHRSIAALVAVAGLALAACGDGGDDDGDVGGGTVATVSDAGPTAGSTDDEPGAEPDAAVGGAWVAVAASVGGEVFELPAGADITLEVDGGDITGVAACNSYGGTAAFADDGSLAVDDLAWTEMACIEPGVMEAEQTYLASLAGTVDAWARSGDRLELSGGGDEWAFERQAPVEDASLPGPTWQLDTYLDGEAAISSAATADAGLRFVADGSAAGSTGCRLVEGTWSGGDGEPYEVHLGPASAAPEAECDAEHRELEDVIMPVLTDVGKVTIEGDRLTLTSSGGTGAQFVAVASEPIGDRGDTDGVGASSLDGPLVVGSHRLADGGEEALLRGTLVLRDDGCLVVTPTGETVVWPAGTTWRSDAEAVVLTSGDVLAVGSRVALGGGYHSAAPHDLGSWVRDLPAIGHLVACVAGDDDGVFVVQHAP